MSWPLMTEDTGRLLRDIGRPVVLMGHSLGGHVAMQTLFRDDPRIHRLVSQLIVVDIAPRSMDFGQSAQHRYIECMEQIDALQLSRNEALARFRQVEPDERLVQFLFTNHGKFPDGTEGFRIPLAALRIGMTTLGSTFTDGISASSAVTQSTSFIKGGASDYMCESDVPTINRLFPNSLIHTIPGSGHWPHHDNPTLFLATLTQAILNVNGR